MSIDSTDLDDFDLSEAWIERRDAFTESMPEYWVSVRLSPSAEPFLPSLDEARLAIPLSDNVPRDQFGWALLSLRFETVHRAFRHLLRLGPEVEVLEPPELRQRMATAARALADLYPEGTS